METIVVLSDQQARFHDVQTERAVNSFLKDFQPDLIVDNGDLFDFESLSNFRRTLAEKQSLMDDVDAGMSILVRQRTACPTARIVLVEGNHEERLTRYLTDHAEELAGVPSLTLPQLVQLDKYGVDYIGPYGAGLDWHGLLIYHGSRLAPHSAYAAKAELLEAGTSGISGHCFSHDTELLVRDGDRVYWTTYVGMREGQNCLTFNTEKRHLEWQPIQRVWIHNNEPELVNFKTASLDLAVTPEHKVLYKSGHAGWHTDNAVSLLGKSKILIPQAAYIKDSEANLDGNIVALAAWYITEGTGLAQGRVSFYQRRSNVGKIKQALTRLGWKSSTRIHIKKGTSSQLEGRTLVQTQDIMKVSLLEPFAKEFLSKWCPSKTSLPGWVWGLPRFQARHFIQTLIEGDGTKNGPNRQLFYTKHKQLADEVQALVLMHGGRSLVRTYRGQWVTSVLFHNGNGSWETFDAHVQRGRVSTIPNTKPVWCVSTENGHVVTRRNGNPAITPQTHRLGAHYFTDRRESHVWLENGCLCNIRGANVPPSERGPRIHNWQQGFTVGFFGSGLWNLYQVSITRHKFVWNDRLYQP